MWNIGYIVIPTLTVAQTHKLHCKLSCLFGKDQYIGIQLPLLPNIITPFVDETFN